MNTAVNNAAQSPQPHGWPRPAEPQPLTLEGLFYLPVSQSLAWRDALELFDTIGDVEHRDDGTLVLHVGDLKTTVHQSPGKDLRKDEVTMLRAFLQRAGMSAGGHMATPRDITTQAKSLLVVVSQHQAKIYQIGPNRRTAIGQEIRPYDPHHFLHRLVRKDRDRQHGQRAPEDPDFYLHIASALAHAEHIVVVGHGTGHSNAAHHLVEYLAAHHPETHARVVSELVVDVSSVTPAQLLESGQQALGV